MKIKNTVPAIIMVAIIVGVCLALDYPEGLFCLGFIPAILYVCDIKQKSIALHIDTLLEIHHTGKTKPIEELDDEATEVILKHLKKAIKKAKI